jgi:hypothetical protein
MSQKKSQVEKFREAAKEKEKGRSEERPFAFVPCGTLFGCGDRI